MFVSEIVFSSVVFTCAVLYVSFGGSGGMQRMDGLKDDMVSPMKEALEKLDRWRLRTFQEFLRVMLVKREQSTPKDINQMSQVEGRSRVEEQNIINENTDLCERREIDNEACVTVRANGRRSFKAESSYKGLAVSVPTEKMLI